MLISVLVGNQNLWHFCLHSIVSLLLSNFERTPSKCQTVIRSALLRIKVPQSKYNGELHVSIYLTSSYVFASHAFENYLVRFSCTRDHSLFHCLSCPDSRIVFVMSKAFLVLYSSQIRTTPLCLFFLLKKIHK
jgi:hypothetical protein